ncbi:MAG TPA: hypothetical protein VLM85_06835 [Polyangiaceae bacterium]|nr:hypothetical protein [Polyangiaceae bacterium]
MRRALALLLPCLGACSNDMPPPLGDPDAAYYAEVVVRPPAEAGADAAADADAGAPGLALDYEGVCTAGKVPVWHFFDFQTQTPGDSALVFTAASAATQSGLDGAPAVSLATVTGPDITAWTGVDVDPKLQSIGQRSQLYLRIGVTFVPASDGTPPVLVHYRQQYDCIVGL